MLLFHTHNKTKNWYVAVFIFFTLVILLRQPYTLQVCLQCSVWVTLMTSLNWTPTKGNSSILVFRLFWEIMILRANETFRDFATFHFNENMIDYHKRSTWNRVPSIFIEPFWLFIAFLSFIRPSIRLSVRPSAVRPSTHLSIRSSVHPSALPSALPAFKQSIYQSIRPSVRPSIHPSKVWNVKNPWELSKTN